MGLMEGVLPVCPLNQHCSQWARMYLKYCLCSVKDGVSLTVGVVSVCSWVVAEVPQIITNYKGKSTEGLSLAFLMTWIIGDLFNLVGCLLEPATLPTQYYMALLYTATTVVLTGQTVYYKLIYHGLKGNKIRQPHKHHKPHQEETVTKEKRTGCNIDKKDPIATDDKESRSTASKEGLHLPSSPIPVAPSIIPRYGSYGRDFYMSARSLSKSPIPTVGSWLVQSRDSSRLPATLVDNQHSAREPLISGLVIAQSAPPLNTKNMLCVVSSALFILGSFSLHLSMRKEFNASPPGMVLKVSRKLLQDMAVESSVGHGGGSSGIGSFLGWAMATIYMGGRLPQIYLNIRRGNIEGLNPLMFAFALVGNATYVASILLNSLDWSRIRPNLPWIVDAGGCVLLDAFILVQFVYFRYRRPKDGGSRYDLYSSLASAN